MTRAAVVRYRVLGSIEAVTADRKLSIGGRHQRLLFAALLLDAGRPVSADRLCELLWGLQQPAHPGAALRSQVARLRRTLEAVGATLRFEADGYRLDVEPGEVDANRFEQLLDAAIGLSGEAAVAMLDDALALWHGSAFAEFGDDPFLQPAAVRLEELRSAAREQRAELLLGLDRPADAVAALRHLVSEFPERERARGLLMEALYRAGRHTEALDEYRSWRHYLASELGLEPAPALQRLHGDIVRHSLRSRAPGPVRERSTRARVPRPSSTFIGRTDDLAQIVGRVAPARLVTITGPGGVGKTRLALEVLLGSDGHFGAPAFADLSALTDPGLVDAAVGDAVDMPTAGGREQGTSLLTFLSNRELLLVLDNCEHLLTAAGNLVADLLVRCPHVSVLATSREPLGIEGECVCRLPSLTDGDATALFVERATDGGARLVLERDLPIIGDICARLDGMPFAVELAAKHAEHLALPRLRELLEDRFRLLVGGPTRALPRHRTLHATMTWSYELLDDAEKHLLRHVAVFAGPFTMDAAAFVDGSTDTLTTAHSLGALHRKSLLSFDHQLGRYRLLETVRTFGRDRLAETDELEEANRRLYDWLLLRAPGPWRYPFTPESPEDVDVELDNLRKVLAWCAAAGRTDAAAVLAAAYGPMWFLTIRGDEGLRWLVLPPEIDEVLPLDSRLAARTAAFYAAIGALDIKRILEIDDHLKLVPPHHPARCALLFAKAWTYVQSDHTDAPRLFTAVRAEAHGDPCWLSNCDLLEGLMRLVDGQVPEAIALLERAVELTEGPGASDAHLNLAVALHLADRHEDVTAIVAELELDRRAPRGYWGDVVAELILVLDAIGHRDLAAARQALARLMTTTAQRYAHVKSAYGFGVQAAAAVAYLAGRPEDALTILAASRRHRLERRYEGGMALARAYEARCRNAVPETAATAATTRGEDMSLNALVALANHTAH